MNNNIKILWIEEESSSSLTERKAYLESNLQFQITVVENFLDGKSEIANNYSDYDVFLIDLLLPFSNENTIMDAHGFELVNQLLELGIIYRVCIYSNEIWTAVNNRIGNFFPEKQFMNKVRCRSSAMLEELILRIANNNHND